MSDNGQFYNDDEMDLLSSTHDIYICKQKPKQPTSLSHYSCNDKTLLAAIVFNQFFAEMTQSIAAPIFPAEATEKGLSETECGFVFGVFSLVQCFVSLIFAKYMSVFGVKKLAMFGQVFCGIFTILFGLLHYIPTITPMQINLYLLSCLCCRILLAIAVAALNTAYFTLSAERFKTNLAIVFGILETISGISFMLAPGISGIIYQYTGYLMPYLSIGVITSSMSIFSYITFPEHSESDEHHKEQTTMKELISCPSVIVTMATTISASIICVILDPTLEPQLRKFKLNSSYVGAIFLLMSTVYAIASPICGWITDRLKQSTPILISGFAVATIGLLLLGPCESLHIAKHNLGVLLAAIILIGISNSFCLIPTYNSIIDSARNLSKDKSINYPLVAGVWQATFSFGGFIGPIASTWVVDTYSFEVMSTTASMMCLLMVVILLVKHAVDVYIDSLKGSRHHLNSIGVINEDHVVVNVL